MINVVWWTATGGLQWGAIAGMLEFVFLCIVVICGARVARKL
jgi:hypothetical protein